MCWVLLCGCSDDTPDDDGSGGGGGAGGGCRDYADVTPGGSFSADVMPLFARSCALAASCHQGDAGIGMEDLGLGPNLANSPAPQATLDGIYDQLLMQTPMRSPQRYVAANAPEDSWLMAKIEYDTAQLGMCIECTDCGRFMPFGSTADMGLSREERDVIAAWILAGAPNN